MIEIYTKNGCPYCVLAKDWLVANNYDYKEHLLDDVNIRTSFYDKFNIKSRTVPQIFNNNTLIGGYSDLVSSELAIQLRFNNNDF